ncbi:MAG: PD40 domain-containing protein [Anaerolineae bacterium]|nr:PD40 domain-containing protein [Anaerolineae bacterium]
MRINRYYTDRFRRILAVCLLLAAGLLVMIISASHPAQVAAAGPTTMLVSITPDGRPANKDSFQPAISADGRFIAFTSKATNLVAGDTNRKADIFVRDLQLGHTERVSVATDGTQANNNSSEPAISGDGRFVVFTSTATNLVPASQELRGDDWYRGPGISVFIHDRQTHSTTLVSVDSNGVPADERAWLGDVSFDGRYVIFSSHCQHLVQPDYNGNRRDVFLHDRVTGLTRMIDLLPNGHNPWEGGSFSAISANGNRIVYRSLDGGLVVGDTNQTFDIFVYDVAAATTRRVSIAADGAQGTKMANRPAISADGMYAAFDTTSTLVTGDTNGRSDVFVHDLVTGITTRVSVRTDGTQANNQSTQASLSGDGRFVAFTSTANNLVAGDTNRQSDIFLHDRQTGTTSRVSLAMNGAEATGGASAAPRVSADGRSVAFHSKARNLIPGLNPGSVNQIYVRILGD